jgi:glyoxylase-like metal-dependent hydrolase (beta-lactamase superfamily II)
MSSFSEVAQGLWQLSLPPLDLVNVFLVGNVLVDSGAAFSAGQVLDALEGHEVGALALTHGHFDHQGGSHDICEALDIPLWCGAKERDVIESGNFRRLLAKPKSLLAAINQRMAGPAHSVTRPLREGDKVGDFMVLDTPGHTPGHISFWRERDRVLVLGDVLFNRNPVTLRRGLQEPFPFLAASPSQNRASARKVAALKPSIVCFGHGSPLASPESTAGCVSRLPID